jgi:transcriptional regulator with XRE-family HTH domain
MGTRRQRLAQRRKSVGLSQEALAERLMIDRSTVARWESGDTEPQPWLRRKLAEVLQISTDKMDELLTHPLAPAGTNDRRGYVLENPVNADMITVTQLRDQVQQLDRTYDTAPSTSLLADTGQCLGQVSFLRTRTTTGRAQRELHAVEAQASTLMGQLVWDASQRRDHATACAYFDKAVAAAQLIGDPNAEGLAFLRKSFVALYGDENPHTGLALTSHTAEITKRASHVLTGLGLLHAAEAHAMLGQRADCERTLAEAERQFEQINIGDSALALFSPTQLGRLAGSCYLYLRDPKHAQPILEQAASHLGDRSKSHAIVLGNLALANILEHKIDEATAALHAAINVVEQTRGGGGLNIVFKAGRELRPWQQDTAVQDVYDRLHSLMVAG